MNAFFDMVARENFVVLDTETTGLRYPAQVVQIAVIDCQGNVLLDALVRPLDPIPADATKIHGITNFVADRATPWVLLRPVLNAVLEGRDLVVYNLEFDTKMLRMTDRLHGLPSELDALPVQSLHCAMLEYADLHAEWDEYHGNNRWHKLENACRNEGIVVLDTHNAVADAYSTLQLVRAMARKQSIKPTVPPNTPAAA